MDERGGGKDYLRWFQFLSVTAVFDSIMLPFPGLHFQAAIDIRRGMQMFEASSSADCNIARVQAASCVSLGTGMSRACIRVVTVRSRPILATTVRIRMAKVAGFAGFAEHDEQPKHVLCVLSFRQLVQVITTGVLHLSHGD